MVKGEHTDGQGVWRGIWMYGGIWTYGGIQMYRGCTEIWISFADNPHMPASNV